MKIFETKNISIPGSRERAILCDVFYTPEATHQPVVIFCHGFKGFKDWGHFDLFARETAGRGMVFVKFNFSHNGTTAEDPAQISDLEGFAQNNYILELEDLKKVMDWIHGYEPVKPFADTQKIYLVGHSRGGGICVLKAGEDKRVRKLVTWASVSGLVNRNKKKTLETWERDGVIFAQNARTGQQLPMYYQFHEILMANKDRLNVRRAARSLKIPYLIVHGTADEVVRHQEAEQLHQSAKKSKLHSIEGAGHTFGVSHPYDRPNISGAAAEVVGATLAFLSEE